jgi:uncharacterized OsmC-like protein
MEEKIIIRQNHRFETEFWYTDPNHSRANGYLPVDNLHSLTPYALLLAGVGSCTTAVLHTYAQNHDLDLQEAEVYLEYRRNFNEDCENCENNHAYEEEILEEIKLTGRLSDQERERLAAVAELCPIRKILEQGTRLVTRFVETAQEEKV